MIEMKNCKYQMWQKQFNANTFGYVYPEDEYIYLVAETLVLQYTTQKHQSNKWKYLWNVYILLKKGTCIWKSFQNLAIVSAEDEFVNLIVKPWHTKLFMKISNIHPCLVPSLLLFLIRPLYGVANLLL